MDMEKISWKAGTTIYRLGDEPDYAYLLTEGEIEIYSNMGTKVGFINQDEVFGEQSILLETKRTITAKASKDSKAFLIPKKTLQRDYLKSSFLIRAILRSTYMRLTNLSSTIKKDLESF